MFGLHADEIYFTYNSQEGLAIKAERMKKKLTGGKKKVEIDEIKVKHFVLLQLLVDINV